MRRFLHAIDDYILAAAPHRQKLALAVFLCGLAMAVFSVFIGVGSIVFEGRICGWETRIGGWPETPGFHKQVGYITAFNWFVFSTFILPAIVATGLQARLELQNIPRALAERGMLVLKEPHGREGAATLTPRQIDAAWGKEREVWIAGAVTVFILVSLFLLRDFVQVVATPMLCPESLRNVALTDNEIEFDWSVAAIFGHGEIGSIGFRVVNIIFSLLAYVLFAVIGVSIFYALFVMFVGFQIFIQKLQNFEGYVLILDLGSDDKRHGFEIFEDFFTSLIQCTFLILVALSLMNLQNFYLRSAEFESIWQLIGADISSLYGEALKIPTEDFRETVWHILINWAGKDGRNILDNFNTAGGIATALGLATIVMAVTLNLLRVQARRARSDARRQLPLYEARYPELSGAEILKRINETTVWPIGWISWSYALAFMLVAAAGVISYRFILVAIGLGAGWVLLKAGLLLPAQKFVKLLTRQPPG